jgi:hypothetical protein
MIKKRGKYFVVIAHSGRKMGTYLSRKRAVKRLRAIEWFKQHPRGKR